MGIPPYQILEHILAASPRGNSKYYPKSLNLRKEYAASQSIVSKKYKNKRLTGGFIKTFQFEDPLLAAMGMKIDCPAGQDMLYFYTILCYHVKMKQKRAYKYRFYPTAEQKHVLARTFGCARFVYNWALRQKTDAFYQDNKRLYYKDLSESLTDLKQKDAYSWLSEVSSVPLQQALRHLEKAFLNFFEGRAKYPTFKKKRHRQSATYTSNAFKWDGMKLSLAKMTEPLDIC